MNTAVSAYVPCFNNEATLASAIESVRAQSLPVSELFVVDDGSTDNSRQVAANLGVEVVALGSNRGRGAARSEAMKRARHDLVLCCDATNTLAPDFLERALPWFDSGEIAAIFGRIDARNPRGAVQRWRSRHLFRSGAGGEPRRKSSLITWGTVLRKSASERVGGFEPGLRQGEDTDLGVRLLEAGLDVVYDPRLEIDSVAQNTLFQTLERYWRWNAAGAPAVGIGSYLKQAVYSVKTMAARDLREGDPLAALISLLAPHYQFWKSLTHGGSPATPPSDVFQK